MLKRVGVGSFTHPFFFANLQNPQLLQEGHQRHSANATVNIITFSCNE